MNVVVVNIKSSKEQKQKSSLVRPKKKRIRITRVKNHDTPSMGANTKLYLLRLEHDTNPNFRFDEVVY